jgi:hypothetical protein
MNQQRAPPRFRIKTLDESPRRQLVCDKLRLDSVRPAQIRAFGAPSLPSIPFCRHPLQRWRFYSSVLRTFTPCFGFGSTTARSRGILFCIHYAAHLLSNHLQMSDKSCGAVILFFSFSLFVYYTFWVILSVIFLTTSYDAACFSADPHLLFVQPFIDNEHVLQVCFFLPSSIPIRMNKLLLLLLLQNHCDCHDSPESLSF